MLNYFDYRKLGDKQLHQVREQLATNATDFRILMTRTNDPDMLFTACKKCTFNAIDECFCVKFL